MKVTLVHSSFNQNESIEEQIAYCSQSTLPIDQLMPYLIEQEYWSSFEMVNICLEIEVSRPIARELLTNRSFSFHQVSHSLDYSVREARQVEWEEKQQEVSLVVRQAYTWAINHGIAKEEAMKILPEGMIVSKMYVNGSLRTWIQYIQERTKPGTSKEHRLLVLECVRVLEPLFPLIRTFVT
jgi:thymidylate synthase (FAD)